MQTDEEVTGGCLCGTARYHYTGEIGPCASCHCADWRKTSGSAFNISIRFAAQLLTFDREARPGRFSKRADSGDLLTREFCLGCGAPLYTESPLHQGFVRVKAGSLDDPSIVQPGARNWTSSWANRSRIDETRAKRPVVP